MSNTEIQPELSITSFTSACSTIVGNINNANTPPRDSAPIPRAHLHLAQPAPPPAASRLALQAVPLPPMLNIPYQPAHYVYFQMTVARILLVVVLVSCVCFGLYKLVQNIKKTDW